MSWKLDGADVAIGDVGAVAYRNRAIDEFLRPASHKRVLCGNKGMGKTLLLSLKRAEERGAFDETSVRLVPVNRPYLDFMGSLPDLGASWHNYLSEPHRSARLWGIAYQVSCLSHVAGVELTLDSRDRHFPQTLRVWINEHRKVAPTLVVRELLSLSVSEFSDLYARHHLRLEEEFRRIKHPMSLFVDKVDQACSQFPRESWTNIQCGLLIATANLSLSNAHVKAYATIRQEAYANLETDVRANVKDVVVRLEYTDEDLDKMLDRLARFYEQSSFSEFLGRTSEIRTQAGFDELASSYIQRHTLRRPRDFVAIADRLSVRERPLTPQVLTECTNQGASEIAGNEAFNEVRPFLSYLWDRYSRSQFLRQLPSNVLARDDLERICREANGGAPIVDYDVPGIHHPFCELYNAGLLGAAPPAPDGEPIQQRFRRPSDPYPLGGNDLPKSSFYFVHPGLMETIRRENPGYRLLKFVAVGDGYDWGRPWELVVRAQRELFVVEAMLDRQDKDVFWKVLSTLASRIPVTTSVRVPCLLDERTMQAYLAGLRDNDLLTKVAVWLDELQEDLRP